MEDLRSGIEHLKQAKAHMSEANGIMSGHISKLKALEEENAELRAKLEAWIQSDDSYMKLPLDADGEILDLLAASVGFVQYRNEDFDEGLLGRMADLIDRPTCEVVSVMFRDDYDEYEVELSCGDSIRWLGTAEDLAFCPSCGAEVVDAERRD